MRFRIRNVLADTRPLANKDYARLWYANIITVIGAQLTIVVVPAQLWAITGDSTYVGLTGVFGLVPLVVFGLWGGAIADAIDRRTVLMISTIGLIVTSAGLAVQAWMGVENVWLILTIFAMQQAFFALNQPARSAIIPMLVPTEQIPAANALNMTVFSFGAIAGPLVGGALLPILGAAWLYGLDAVTLLATLWAVIKLPHLEPTGKSKSLGLRSVIDGFRYTWVHKILLVSFVIDLIAMVFGMPRALYPQIANLDFGGPSGGGMEFAILSASMAVGALVGGVFSGWVSRVRRQGLAVIVAILVWGAAIVGFGASVGLAGGVALPFLIGAFAMLALGGAADMASAAFRQSILQTAATDDVRGRLQGVFIVVVAGGPRIADVLHGYAANYFSAAWVVAGGGILVILGTLICAAASPQFRRYRI